MTKIESLAYLCRSFRDHTFSPDHAEAYLDGLGDFTEAEVLAGVRWAIEHASPEDYVPNVPKLRSAIIAAKRSAAPSSVSALPAHPVDPMEGEWREIKIPGIAKTLRVRVLPDDHPALPRYHCATCQDSGWAPAKQWHPAGYYVDAVARCICYSENPVIRRRLERKMAEQSGE